MSPNLSGELAVIASDPERAARALTLLAQAVTAPAPLDVIAWSIQRDPGNTAGRDAATLLLIPGPGVDQPVDVPPDVDPTQLPVEDHRGELCPDWCWQCSLETDGSTTHDSLPRTIQQTPGINERGNPYPRELGVYLTAREDTTDIGPLLWPTQIGLFGLGCDDRMTTDEALRVADLLREASARIAPDPAI